MSKLLDTNSLIYRRRLTGEVRKAISRGNVYMRLIGGDSVRIQTISFPQPITGIFSVDCINRSIWTTNDVSAFHDGAGNSIVASREIR